MRCDPMTQLENGTKVTVNGTKTGTVISSEIVRAQPSGFIVMHTIRITATIKRTGYHEYTERPCTPKTIRPNYSFITY